jgi:hypothetical protein
MIKVDYLVVGSGCSGSMAAQTLVEAGLNVTMVDVGALNNQKPLATNKSYQTIRKTEKDQYRYFIGEELEETKRTTISKGAQITPARSYITKYTNELLPVESSTFSAMESLAYGGLGVGWGLQCWEFSRKDLMSAGLQADRIKDAYETVSKRIGISGTDDLAAAYTLGSLSNYQPSPRMDQNHSYMYNKYLSRSSSFLSNGVYLGRTPLALITKDLGKRQGYKYKGMDFYSDHGLSAWRPFITVNELKRKANFNYLDSLLVISFSETRTSTIVECLDIKKDELVKIQCRKLILTSGALGTARIILRSLGSLNTKLPILSNPHLYVPCLQPKMVGRGVETRKLGFGQLSLFIDEHKQDSNLSVASTYSYQSLMLFRIIRQQPLNFADARIIMQYLQSGLIIMIIQHPDSPSVKKTLKLISSTKSVTGDILRVNYHLSDEEKAMQQQRERQYLKVMRKLNTYAIKKVSTEPGASIHYAGTVPFSNKDQSFRLHHSGRLYGTKSVYVADSSGYNFLPAKGLTFTLMANAHLTAENVINNA